MIELLDLIKSATSLKPIPLKIIGCEQDFGLLVIRVPDRRFGFSRDLVQVSFGERRMFVTMLNDRELNEECIVSGDVLLNLGCAPGDFVHISKCPLLQTVSATEVIVNCYKTLAPYHRLLTVCRAYATSQVPVVDALLNQGLLSKVEQWQGLRAFLAAMLNRPLNPEYCMVNGDLLFRIVSFTRAPNVLPILTRGTTVRNKQETIKQRLQSAFENVGGLKDQVKRIISRIALPIDHAACLKHLNIKPLKGLLLYGPPGTGKTLVAQTVASAVRASFYAYSAAEFASKWVGEPERKIRGLFQKARQNAPSIIFIDEFDAIAGKRTGENEQKIVNQLLTQMDGISTGEGYVFVMAATNRETELDPAIRRAGRFDMDIQIPPPDRTGRLEILKILLKNTPLSPNVSFDQLAVQTHGYTGADLKLLHKQAGFSAIERAQEHGIKVEALTISQEDFEEALPGIRPSGLKGFNFIVPLVSWSQVIGAESEIESINKQFIVPYRNAERFEAAGFSLPRGLIFHGPPGTGKTLLACALATQLGFNMITLRGPELSSKYVGETEERIRELFKKARNCSPCMILIDEIDGFIGQRNEGSLRSQHDSSVIAQILAEVDGLTKTKEVLIVGTTNRLKSIDPALTRAGRLDRKIYVGLPSAITLQKILRRSLSKLNVSLPRAELFQYASSMQAANMTGADVTAFCRTLLSEALFRGCPDQIPEALTRNVVYQMIRRKEKDNLDRYSVNP